MVPGESSQWLHTHVKLNMTSPYKEHLRFPRSTMAKTAHGVDDSVVHSEAFDTVSMGIIPNLFLFHMVDRQFF